MASCRGSSDEQDRRDPCSHGIWQGRQLTRKQKHSTTQKFIADLQFTDSHLPTWTGNKKQKTTTKKHIPEPKKE